jgi:signal transduction histidine kinase
MSPQEKLSLRDSPEEIARKHKVVEDVPLVRRTLDAMPNMVVVLNQNRQVVSANDALLKLLDITVGDALAKRPGEVLNCIHPPEGTDGCGTALHCVTCGALTALLESQRTDSQVVRECRILTNSATGIIPLDLKVTATPLAIGGDRFIVAAVEDISQAKRLAVLYKTFFHDVLNMAGCIRSYAYYLNDLEQIDRDLCRRIAGISDDLIEAIRAQRDLTAAESGELEVFVLPLQVGELLDDVCQHYARHSAEKNQVVDVECSWNGLVHTDRLLVLRVLGNMLKNALEADGKGGTVTISCRRENDAVIFSVHNQQVMPEDVQLQVFQRSFSTKDSQGRGIGTYSMKLFGEQYLGGKVSFTSREGKGTTFTLTIPIAASVK